MDDLALARGGSANEKEKWKPVGWQTLSRWFFFLMFFLFLSGFAVSMSANLAAFRSSITFAHNILPSIPIANTSEQPMP
jgi:hypothetical protein